MFYVRNTKTGKWLNTDEWDSQMWVDTPERAGGRAIRDNWSRRLSLEHFTQNSPIEMVWIREPDGWKNYCGGIDDDERLQECMERRAKARWTHSPMLNGDDLFAMQQIDIKELMDARGFNPYFPTDSWARYCCPSTIFWARDGIGTQYDNYKEV
jgi:hypothetical protein